jgi:hypothetical protein
MKQLPALLVAIFFASCDQEPTQPPAAAANVLAYVHWQEEGLAGKKLELLEAGDVKLTDSTGRALFIVHAGSYTLRAYDINRGGPAYRNIDFNVKAAAGDTVTVDIVDCLPCD